MSNQTSLRAHDKLELIFMVFLSVNLELGKAFVICEDFDQNFHPLNLKTPKCLLPIANREPLGRFQIQHSHWLANRSPQTWNN